jgi:hypothetical protein
MAPTTNTSATSMAKAGSGVGFGEGVVIAVYQEYFAATTDVHATPVGLLGDC